MSDRRVREIKPTLDKICELTQAHRHSEVLADLIMEEIDKIEDELWLASAPKNIRR